MASFAMLDPNMEEAKLSPDDALLLASLVLKEALNRAPSPNPRPLSRRGILDSLPLLSNLGRSLSTHPSLLHLQEVELDQKRRSEGEFQNPSASGMTSSASVSGGFSDPDSDSTTLRSLCHGLPSPTPAEARAHDLFPCGLADVDLSGVTVLGGLGPGCGPALPPAPAPGPSSAVPGTRLPSPPSPAPSAAVDVYVMLPLDEVILVHGQDGLSDMSVIRNEPHLRARLASLRAAGVHGVHLDLWWGIAERQGPRRYDFAAFRRLILLCRDAGLRVQVMASFHAAGGNVGDHDCVIPLPPWVLHAANRDPDLLYTDRCGRRNAECLSLGCDHVPIDDLGRTPPQIYADLIAKFASENRDLIEEGVIAEVCVGMGPAGELRYPSYPQLLWQFPGVGEFQAYDRYLTADLSYHAAYRGRPDWGTPPSDAGSYNSVPEETAFFRREGGGWSTEYGRFFLGWYSGALVAHLDRVLGATRKALFSLPPAHCPRLSVKLAGVHWLYGHPAHAGECTAGYYNVGQGGAPGYASIIRTLSAHGASLSFTAIEMRDQDHPSHALARPQALVEQVLSQARDAGVAISGENALPRYDPEGLSYIAETFQEKIHRLTYLRMNDALFEPGPWSAFRTFVRQITCGPGPFAPRSAVCG